MFKGPSSAGEKTYLILLLILLGLAISLPPARSKNNDAKAPGAATMLVISGHGVRSGGVRIFLSSQGVRIVDNMMSALWMTDKPREALLLNDENKTMMTVPATGYARRFHHPAFRFEDAETEPAAFKSAYPSYKLVLYAGKRRNKHKRAEITFLKNVPLPPAVIAHWQSVLVGAGAPAGHLPVGVYQYSGRFHDSEDNIKRREWMDLLKPSRVSLEALDKRMFLPPKYRKARDKADFMFADGGELKSHDIDDMFAGKVK
ncbi:MAG TPA: hypothetical protein PK671_07790 [Candidatus Obscuribacter sp.]|nr:hypothetical protein [Candidatus Obscuribacter sp.]HMY52837.1 hypothetical protein [Candidatus Obscuribacter sp.]HNG73131.1 hypothetical protein [Candidatus Obscuribacter sp.]